MTPEPASISGFFTTLKKATASWINDDTLSMGAALAYYAVFSVSPLLVIALSITGLFYEGASTSYIQTEMAELIGENAAMVIAGTVQAVHQSPNGFTATLLSMITLFIGASSVFVQLQYAMNRIWEVTPQPGHFMKDFLKQRLASFAMIVGVGFLLLTSLLLSAALAAINGYFSYLFPAANPVWYVMDLILSFVVVAFVFAAIFKIVPDVDIAWSDVWPGAVLTAVLFTAGKFAIGFYLGRSGIGSAFGAAGSVLVILAWVYYSSQILFFGAEFTKVHTKMRRNFVLPAKGATTAHPERTDPRGKILRWRFFWS